MLTMDGSTHRIWPAGQTPPRYTMALQAWTFWPGKAAEMTEEAIVIQGPLHPIDEAHWIQIPWASSHRASQQLAVPLIHYPQVVTWWPPAKHDYTPALLARIAVLTAVADGQQRLRQEDQTAPCNLPELPALESIARAYQKRGIKLMAAHPFLRLIQADGLGVGKSIQALGAVEMLLARHTIAAALFVVPASMKWVWRDEAIQKFVPARLPTTLVIGGPPAQRAAQYATLDQYTHIIVNYDLIWREPDRTLLLDWVARRQVALIPDEAHAAKNLASHRGKAVKQLAKRATAVYLLSGTPLLNNLGELYSLLSILKPELFVNKQRFLAQYAHQDYWGRDIAVKDAAGLAAVIQPFFLRRTKDEVLAELPAVTTMTRVVDLLPEQQAQYREAKEELCVLLASGERLTITTLFTQILRFRQITDGAFLLDPFRTQSCKLAALAEVLPDLLAEHPQVVVFSQFVPMVDAITAWAEAQGYRPLLLKGAVPQKARAAMMAAFRADPTHRLFVMDTAGGEGINLQTASAMVFIDKLWTPAKNEQIIGRIHRFGQTRPVVVVQILARQTVDEKVEVTLARKFALFQEVMRAADGGIAKHAFSDGQIRSILQEVI